MATNLNPGADATLVAAAYRAAMANVPQDNSKAFTAMAEGYAKGMEGLQAAITPILESTDIAGPLVEKIKNEITSGVGKLFTKTDMETPENEEIDTSFTEQQQTWFDNDIDFYDSDMNEDNWRNESIESRKGFQRDLQKAGFSIDYQKEDGTWVRGENAVDGVWGDATKEAYKKALEFQKEYKSSVPYLEGQSGKMEAGITIPTEDRDKIAKAISSGDFSDFDNPKMTHPEYGEMMEDYNNIDDFNAAMREEDSDWEDVEAYDITTKEGKEAYMAIINERYQETIDYYTEEKAGFDQKALEAREKLKVINYGESYKTTNDYGQPVNYTVATLDQYALGLKETRSALDKKYRAGDKTGKNDDNPNKAQYDAEIAAIDSQLENMRDSRQEFRQLRYTLAQHVGNWDFNEQATGPETLQFLEALHGLGKPLADGSHVKMMFEKDGTMNFAFVDKYGKAKKNSEGNDNIISPSELNGKLIKKDQTTRTGTNKAVTTDQVTLGKSSVDGVFNENAFVNTVSELYSSKESFLDGINTHHSDLPNTYREFVYGVTVENGKVKANPNWATAGIYDELQKLSGSFDNDGSGTVDENDFVTPENFAAMAKYLTSYNTTAKRTFAKFLMGDKTKGGMKAFNDGYRIKNPIVTPPVVTDGYVNLTGNDKGNYEMFTGANNNWKPVKEINNLVGKMNAREKIEGTGGLVFTWDKEKGYIDQNGDQIKNPKTLLQTYFGEMLSPTYMQSDSYASITGWDDLTGGGSSGGASGVNQDQLNTLVKRWGANKSNLKKLGYGDDKNAQALLDMLNELGVVSKFKEDGGEILVDGETIKIKGKDDAKYFERTGDSTGFLGMGAGGFDKGDVKQILDKLGVSYPGSQQGEDVG